MITIAIAIIPANGTITYYLQPNACSASPMSSLRFHHHDDSMHLVAVIVQLPGHV